MELRQRPARRRGRVLDVDVVRRPRRQPREARACRAGRAEERAVLVVACVEIKILRRVRAESSRRPPRVTRRTG